MPTVANPMAITQMRTVLAGERRGEVWIITLGGGEEVETTNPVFFRRCGTAKAADRPLSLTLVPGPNGRPVITAVDVEGIVPAPAQTPEVLPAEPLGDRVLRTAAEFREVWNSPATRRDYNVLTPVSDFSALPEYLGIMCRAVEIDPDPSREAARDVYEDKLFTRAGEVALTKNGLNKIAQGFGASISTERKDNGNKPHVWEVVARVSYRGFDGGPHSHEAREEFDLRDGTARAARMSAAQLVQARAKGLRQCEARACNAAIRAAFNLKQVYTVEELRRKFLVPLVIVVLDMKDPDIKAIVAHEALRGNAALYGPPEGLAPPSRPRHDAPDIDEDEERERYMEEVIGRDDENESVSFIDGPPIDPPIGHTRVVKVTPHTKPNVKWVRYEVVFSEGNIADTFDKALHPIIDQALATQALVRIQTEPNPRDEKYNDILKSIEVVDPRQPALPVREEGY